MVGSKVGVVISVHSGWNLTGFFPFASLATASMSTIRRRGLVEASIHII